MNSAGHSLVQVRIMGLPRSTPFANMQIPNLLLSSLPRRTIPTQQSTKRNLFPGIVSEDVTKLFNEANDENRKHLFERYGFDTLNPKEVVPVELKQSLEKQITDSNCSHENLIELEQKEYKNKIKNSSSKRPQPYISDFFPISKTASSTITAKKSSMKAVVVESSHHKAVAKNSEETKK